MKTTTAAATAAEAAASTVFFCKRATIYCVGVLVCMVYLCVFRSMHVSLCLCSVLVSVFMRV